jgi:tRNA threonylcarbamoyladenosine biosynthesis protein TsaE
MHYISKNEEDTKTLARQIGERLWGGEVLALFGDLGSGKTTFTKGLAEYFNIQKEITSPTFVIMKQYVVSNQQIHRLVHIDAYRLLSAEDAESIGLPELLEDKHSIFVIEWPGQIEGLFEKNKVIKLFFEYISENERRILVKE